MDYNARHKRRNQGFDFFKLCGLYHDNGMQVWVLVDDFSANDNGERYVDKVLASTLQEIN